MRDCQYRATQVDALLLIKLSCIVQNTLVELGKRSIHERSRFIVAFEILILIVDILKDLLKYRYEVNNDHSTYSLDN